MFRVAGVAVCFVAVDDSAGDGVEYFQKEPRFFGDKSDSLSAGNLWVGFGVPEFVGDAVRECGTAPPSVSSAVVGADAADSAEEDGVVCLWRGIDRFGGGFCPREGGGVKGTAADGGAGAFCKLRAGENYRFVLRSGGKAGDAAFVDPGFCEENADEAAGRVVAAVGEEAVCVCVSGSGVRGGDAAVEEEVLFVKGGKPEPGKLHLMQ